MRISNAAAHALTAYATLTMVAGCSGAGSQLAQSAAGNGPTLQSQRFAAPLGLGPPSVLAPGTVPVSRPVTGGTYLSVDAKKVGLIYVATGASIGTVDIYPLVGKNQKQVGQITGLTNPGGLAIDHKGNLYIANEGANNILEYSPGTKPKLVATLNDSGQYPVGVSVDPKTGDIAATNFETTTLGSGSVSFYHFGATMPYKTVTAFTFTYFAGFDDQGNLFVDGRTNSSPPTIQVGKIRAGGTTIATLPISGIAFPGGVKVDNVDNLLIDDQTSKTINCYAATSPYASCGTTPLGDAGDPVDFALLNDNKYLYTADVHAPGLALAYAFPAGGEPVNTITVGGYSVGVAISPAARP
jgi:hypothetical protein